MEAGPHGGRDQRCGSLHAADWSRTPLVRSFVPAFAEEADDALVDRFKRAVDLKNLETFTGGKSDPYVRVLHGGIVVARSRVIDDDLNPVW